MRILAIESSCDETAASVVESGPANELVKVISNVVTSSAEMHKKTGGIVPEVAAREQLRSIIPVIRESIKASAHKSVKDLDAIAVTVGPGLVGSLLVGVETARALAYAWEKPLLQVNHLVAHLYANFVRENRNDKRVSIPKLPAIGLVVSGGHTELVLMKSHKKIKRLGGTRDDAAGECFDKCARLLGLGYPGGPAIAKASQQMTNKFKAQSSKFKLPRPLINSDDYDFSFSGLKTATMNRIKNYKLRIKNKNIAAEIARELQEAIVEVLVMKTLKAVEEFKPKSVLVGGGVASNRRLRQRLRFEIRNSKLQTRLHIPPPELCTDNAVMIGGAAFYGRHPRGAGSAAPEVSWRKIKVEPGLEIGGEN